MPVLSNLLRLSFLFKSCGLWTLSCAFVPHNYETLKWLSSLPTLMQESSGGDNAAIGIMVVRFLWTLSTMFTHLRIVDHSG